MSGDTATAFFPPLPVGHLDAQREVRALHAAGRLPHGLLFHGPKGIGKRLLAERLAWHLICGQGSDSFEGFGYDTTARAVPQMAAGAYPYLHILTPDEDKKTISVEQVRQKISTLSLTAEGWRVVIIDSADELHLNAANALLKTLEEPNSKTVLVLISHNPSRLLPTIISRCRQYRLRPLDRPQTEAVLLTQGVTDPAERAVLADISSGCPGTALAMRDTAPPVSRALDAFFAALGTPRAHLTALETAETLADKKLASTSGTLLLWRLAALARGEGAYAAVADRLPAHGWARLHQHVTHRLSVQQELNLPLQLTLENALQDVITSLHTAA